MQKLWGYAFLCGSTPEMVRSLRSHRSLRSRGPGVSGPWCFAVEWCCVVRSWTVSGGTPEKPRSLRSSRNLRPLLTGVSGVPASAPKMPKCGASLLSVRSIPGDGPESPAWPESPALWPESPVPGSFCLVFGQVWCVSGKGPEHPRRWSGISDLAGVSGPLDRILRSAQ